MNRTKLIICFIGSIAGLYLFIASGDDKHLTWVAYSILGAIGLYVVVDALRNRHRFDVLSSKPISAVIPQWSQIKMWAVLLLLVVMACGIFVILRMLGPTNLESTDQQKRDEYTKLEQRLPITKDQAIALAKTEVHRRGSRDPLEVSHSDFTNGIWRITLSRLPHMPEGHATVEISPQGKVIRYLGGK